MQDESRTFVVDELIADEVRELIHERVRLRFSEGRHGFWIFSRPYFFVTGPANQLDALANEIRQLELELAEDRLW